jgi:hypothetical protein
VDTAEDQHLSSWAERKSQAPSLKQNPRYRLLPLVLKDDRADSAVINKAMRSMCVSHTEVVDEMTYSVHLADRKREVVDSEAGQGLFRVQAKQLRHASVCQYTPAALYPNPSPTVWTLFKISEFTRLLPDPLQ